MMHFLYNGRVRKIVHVDMDCFYAAVEMRDNPSLVGKPMAVGGGQTRGVVATCNYEARRFGVRSAMSGIKARRLCPRLIFIPPDFDKYHTESQHIRALMRRYTDRIEPLSLDEAYLDLTDCPSYDNSATLIAGALKRDLRKETGLTASAGVAPNKFLAKIASDWDKPDGLMVISPRRVAEFVRSLPLARIPGVGRVTNEKLRKLGWSVCGDLQKVGLAELTRHFGAFGAVLHQRAFGHDDRRVITARDPKSLSVEATFRRDLHHRNEMETEIRKLLRSLEERLARVDKPVQRIFVKVRFADFTLTTKQAGGLNLSASHLIRLGQEAWHRKRQPIRLIGVGVDFVPAAAMPVSNTEGNAQPELFE